MRVDVPVRLGDDRVSLRPMVAGDARPYVQAFRGDRNLGRLLGLDEDPEEQTIADQISAEAEVQAGDDRSFFRLAIADPASDQFWGELIVFGLNARHRRGEVGFWVVPSQRRRGIGSRAVALMLSWLFDELDLFRVEMTTTPENQVVPALAGRLGFTREGVLRSRNRERGQRVDVVWFGLLRDEWPRP